jgi:ubiquinone/menaquinone biosynthesis C-methylase UbiE
MDRFQNTRQPNWDWWGRLWPTPGATLRQLGVTSGETVAEIGCGNGYFALPAARITTPSPVYALDIDETLLNELASLADRSGIGNITTINGDARSLTGQLPEPVDTVLIANTFHGIDDTETFVREAYESLRPGGRFIVVNWEAREREQTHIAGEPRGPPTELRLSAGETEHTVLTAAAFDLTKTIALPPHHYGLVFDR